MLDHSVAGTGGGFVSGAAEPNETRFNFRSAGSA